MFDRERLGPAPVVFLLFGLENDSTLKLLKCG